MMCGVIWPAMLLFETKLQSYLRMGIMYLIFHLGRYIVVIHGLELRFTVQPMRYHITKFQPVYIQRSISPKQVSLDSTNTMVYNNSCCNLKTI